MHGAEFGSVASFLLSIVERGLPFCRSRTRAGLAENQVLAWPKRAIRAFNLRVCNPLAASPKG